MLSTKEKEIYFQRNEIATQKTNNVLKEQRIKIEEHQNYIFMSMVALALGLLSWAVWNYRKQKQLIGLLEQKRHKLETQAQVLA